MSQMWADVFTQTREEAERALRTELRKVGDPGFRVGALKKMAFIFAKYPDLQLNWTGAEAETGAGPQEESPNSITPEMLQAAIQAILERTGKGKEDVFGALSLKTPDGYIVRALFEDYTWAEAKLAVQEVRMMDLQDWLAGVEFGDGTPMN